jgi:citrate synthase
MTHENRPIRSDIAWSSPDRIVVRGKDLANEIIGHFNFGDFAYLQITGRTPNANESRMFNAILVTLAEHGITPSVIAARMTYLGAPESPQAAVAAGLCGLGTVFVGSTEDTARMLHDALPDSELRDLKTLAETVVSTFRELKAVIPGLGHPIHKPVDPRTVRLFSLARTYGVGGRFIELMEAIADAIARASGRRLTINSAGAVGAICCEIRVPWRAVRGVGVAARAVGLVGHILEETGRPIAREIWLRSEEEASMHFRSE